MILKKAGHFPSRTIPELYKTVTHLNNILPHRRTGNSKTPYELVLGKKPDLSYLRSIGCKAYVHVPGALRPGKHSDRARIGTLIGYDRQHASKYRILMDHKTGEIIETKDVTFAERVPNLRGIVHSMPGPNAQHWFQPEVLDPNDSISQMVSSPPTVDS